MPWDILNAPRCCVKGLLKCGSKGLPLKGICAFLPNIVLRKKYGLHCNGLKPASNLRHNLVLEDIKDMHRFACHC